jgi:hypothetical protein
MRALLYVVFVTIGGLLSIAIGYLIEPRVSMTASLTVFLVLFFANFVVSWMAVVRVMNDSLEDVPGQQTLLDIEKAAQEATTARPRLPMGTPRKTLVEDGYH